MFQYLIPPSFFLSLYFIYFLIFFSFFFFYPTLHFFVFVVADVVTSPSQFMSITEAENAVWACHIFFKGSQAGQSVSATTNVTTLGKTAHFIFQLAGI